MDQHTHPFITIGAALATGVATGVVSLQDMDLKLAIALKIVSIISFTIGAMYALWKWNADHKINKEQTLVMEEAKEKRKQKAKKETK